MSSPVQPIQAQAAPAQPTTPTQATAPAEIVPTLSDGSGGTPINLQKSYSLLNERLTKLFDESGVKRNFTAPYISEQPTEDHIAAVGNAAAQSGGLTANLLTSSHHSSGKGWGSGDGQTVGHGSDALQNTIIPEDDENAVAVLSAAHSLLNKISSLLGDDEPAVKIAEAQLRLVGSHDGAGMNLLDFGCALQQIFGPPIQAVARSHSGTKQGGHSPQLRAPRPPRS
jgi:hypothetical protein